MPATSGRGLSIIIPAYNEEEAIEAILSACLAAREPIKSEAGLSSVEVICVDDGSKDQTAQLARKFGEVKLISHPVNKGYGAALMTGFGAASQDLLGFLDADGTCDPLVFGRLCKALEERQADLCVGNRLHEDSKMPKVRRLGNRFYALVVSKLTGVSVKDTASGMRVFKKSLLPELAPLPTGLHFTPAMTARAACMGAKIVERPIPYADRQGESKLNVVQDGARFLRVILGIIFAYFPLRVFGPLGALCLLVAAAYGAGAVSMYAREHLIEEWLIYRLLTVLTLGVCGTIFLCFGLVAQRLANVALRRPSGWLDASWVRRGCLAAGALLGLGGVLLNLRTIEEYVSSGHIYVHWVYVLTGGLCVILASVLVSFAITLGIAGHLPQPPEPA